MKGNIFIKRPVMALSNFYSDPDRRIYFVGNIAC